MKHSSYMILMTLMLGTVLLVGCSAKEAPATEPRILSLKIVDQSGRTHVGKIDGTYNTVTINTLDRNDKIAAVKFKLTPDASIEPDPGILLTECKKNNKFMVSNGNRSTEYHVLIPNYGEEESPDLEEGKSWQLVWEDNFDGPWFDDKTWGKTPEGNPDWCKQMALYDDLFDVSDGILTLWAKKNDNHPEDARTSLTGGLSSRDLKAFKGGKITVRARHDKAGGFWPAIWLRPQDGPKEEYSEVDIVELVKGKAHQTLHTDYTIAMKEKGTPVTDNTVSFTMDDFEGWHEYFVELHENKVVLGVDGVTRITYTKAEDLAPDAPQQFPFGDRSFYLILSSQLGGKWAGNIVLADLPARLQIDYVKYYEYK